MNFAKVFSIVLLILFSVMTINAQQNLTLLKSQFDELNRTFTYINKPITPAAIWQISQSDGPHSVIVSFDVIGVHGAKHFPYFVKYLSDENGYVSFSFKDLLPPENANGEEITGSFAYKHLGRLKNNLHILQTINSADKSTGIMKSVLFVRTSIDEGVPNLSGKSMLISRINEIELGPGYTGTIKVFPDQNTVEIGAGKYFPAKQIIKIGE